MISFEITKRTDPRLPERMTNHYSKPKGFVGRNICYAVYFNDCYYGHIVAGSATRFLPNRNEYFGIELIDLNKVINNIFFNISKINEKYPIRNFTSEVVRKFCLASSEDWYNKYGDRVIGFETLIEKPRTGELYKKAGWDIIGETKGFTCKRIAGKGTDCWSGKRIWNTNVNELRPKIVMAYKL